MRDIIFFDLDNTLIDRDAAAKVVFAAHGLSHDQGEAILAEDGAGHALRQELITHIHPDEDVLDLLSALAESATLGLISNGGSDTQRVKLSAAGLDDLFPEARRIISGDHGVAKPEARIFEIALAALDTVASQCTMIGDNFAGDILPARALGMQAIWRAPDSSLEACLCQI